MNKRGDVADYRVGQWWCDPKLRDRNSDDHGMKFDVEKEPSRTVQSEKDAADINIIMDRFTRTGVLSNLNHRSPMYGDFSDFGDFREAMEIVLHGQEMFNALDAKVRERFHNNPAEFLEFMQDGNNAEEAIKLGLAVERKPTVGFEDVVSELKKVQDVVSKPVKKKPEADG